MTIPYLLSTLVIPRNQLLDSKFPSSQQSNRAPSFKPCIVEAFGVRTKIYSGDSVNPDECSDRGCYSGCRKYPCYVSITFINLNPRYNHHDSCHLLHHLILVGIYTVSVIARLPKMCQVLSFWYLLNLICHEFSLSTKIPGSFEYTLKVLSLS